MILFEVKDEDSQAKSWLKKKDQVRSRLRKKSGEVRDEDEVES